MSGPARIKGTSLTLLVGTNELHAQATSVLMDNEEADGDVVTFADAEEGGAYTFFFQLTNVQSTDTDAFWSWLWENPGAEVAFRFPPHGNDVATPNQPHFVGTLKTLKRPPLGGDAGTNNTFTFDHRLEIVGVPERDNGAAGQPLITTVTPDTADNGDVVTISGSRFTGVTAVTIDGIAAEFAQISDATIVAAIPGAASGAANVVVTNPDGASAPFPITVI